jgi:hypothetical protein
LAAKKTANRTVKGAGGREKCKWLAVGKTVYGGRCGREEEMAWEETEEEGRRFCYQLARIE